MRRNNTHEGVNPQKKNTMAKPIAWSSGMAMVIESHLPRPVNLTAMGNTMPHTKDFFQKLKLAKEIINLIKATILYYSLHPPNSTAPRTIEYRSPCIPRLSRVLSYPSPVAPASNLVGCCV
jgi:hypothetical protein